MDDVCDSNSLVSQFFSKLDVPGLAETEICYKSSGSVETYLFNPDNESEEFLTAWLTYRGENTYLLRNKTQEQLSEFAARNFRQAGNEPPIALFVDFDPKSVSEGFLIVWLSWYGVTSVRERSREWWETTAEKIRTRVQQLQKMKKARNQFEVLLAAKKKLRQIDTVLSALENFTDMIPNLTKQQEREQQVDRKALANHLQADFINLPLFVPKNKSLRDVLVSKQQGFFAKITKSFLGTGLDVLKKTGKSVLKEFLQNKEYLPRLYTDLWDVKPDPGNRKGLSKVVWRHLLPEIVKKL